MYCLKCGKKIPDIALFCPFCGAAADGGSPAGASCENTPDTYPGQGVPDPYPGAGMPDPLPEPEDPWGRPDRSPSQKSAPEGDLFLDDDVQKEAQYAPDPDGAGARRGLYDPEPRRDGARPGAYDPDEDDVSSLFDEDDEEAFDSDYDDGPDDSYGRPGRYEDEEPSGFFIRHIRGIVGGGLTLMLVLILLLWGYSAGGQKVLARMDLAWQDSAYARIAKTEFDLKRYYDAARYYEKAFSKCPENERKYRHNYALSAAICYDNYGDMANARKWYMKSIDIDSGKLEGYVGLRGTFSDATSIPPDARTYIQKGYTLTHDERLNLG